MGTQRKVEDYDQREMIEVEGQLNIKSADSTIDFFSEDGQLICHIKGLPKGIPINDLNQLSKQFGGFSIQPVTIYFNGKKLGVYRDGKIREKNLATFTQVFGAYIKNKF